MDFVQLGKRIRTIRLEKKLSQETLSQMIDTSSTHISHIENASTKLSLSVFVDIANALQVSPDKLLSDSVYQSKEVLSEELAAVFSDVNSDEFYVMLRAAASVKEAIRIRKLSSENL